MQHITVIINELVTTCASFKTVVNIRMWKQILLDLEYGFVHKAKEARHIRMCVNNSGECNNIALTVLQFDCLKICLH